MRAHRSFVATVTSLALVLQAHRRLWRPDGTSASLPMTTSRVAATPSPRCTASRSTAVRSSSLAGSVCRNGKHRVSDADPTQQAHRGVSTANLHIQRRRGIMRSVQSTVMVGLAFASISALAADPEKIPKDELKEAVAGKTLTYKAANGATLRVQYAANGRLTGTGTGFGGRSLSSGEWTVNEEGMLCQKIRQGPMPDRCFFLMRTGGAYGISVKGDALGTPATLE